MSAKKNTKATASSDSMPALKIGSRVRCTDDGVTGKITWANGVSVKIKWDDGEQVTWKRAELPGKPIEILAADDEPRNEEPAPETETETAEAAPVTEQVATTEATEPVTETATTTSEQVVAAEAQTMDAAMPIPEQSAETPATEPIPTIPEPTEAITRALGIYIPEAAAPAKPKRERKVKTPAEPKEKKMSALDAAARVLAEAGTALTCKEMIGAMAIKGYWTSPGGQTPDATLCSAILREIKVKGEQSRFVKAAPGRFAFRPTA